MENGKNWELKVRVIKSEIRESKREREKCLNMWTTAIAGFVFSIIGCFYFRQEMKTWQIFITTILMGLFCLFFGFYWFNKYQKAGQKIEQLKQELKKLKKELAEKDSNTRLE